MLSSSPAPTSLGLHTSVEILKEKISAWMLQKTGQPPWFPGEGGEFSPLWQNAAEVCDVVFFGNFMAQFLHMPLWQKKTYRLWVLSENAQNTLATFFQLPREAIAVIPREELFPLVRASQPFPDLSQGCTFTYGGRFSFSKNFGLMLRVVSALQCEQGVPVSFAAYGQFDDVGREDLGIPEVPHYEERVHKLLAHLDWEIPPQFHFHFTPDSWVHELAERSVFFNLSQFYMDDFGVALAQAQAQGIPALLSRWGGHLELGQLQVKWLDLPLAKILNEKEACDLASNLAKKILTVPAQEVKLKHRAKLPLPLSFEVLKRSYFLFLQAWGVEARALQAIGEEALEFFARSPMGKTFFERYHHLFSGQG